MTFGSYFRSLVFKSIIGQNTLVQSRKLSFTAKLQQVEFGILCDVDGVLTRGKSPISGSLNAFKLLHDEDGNWRAPVLFLTNAGNVLKRTKAAEISEVLKCKVAPDEILMSHTALKLYSSYFKKHVAVCGSGPTKDIAKNIGFTKCSTIDEISEAFPWLDACKPKKQIYSGISSNPGFEKIEAIVLLGEPERWEHSLQILIDLLVQNGDPNQTPQEYLPLVEGVERPHIPVFACSSDLVWASGAPCPRIAHGSFLVCLEALYERMSGQELNYTALVGKPSPTTYVFAHSQLNAIAASKLGSKNPLKRIYCIGDNPNVDVYGANLYNRCLPAMSDRALNCMSTRIDSLVHDEHPELFPATSPTIDGVCELPVNREDLLWKSIIENSSKMKAMLKDVASRQPMRDSPCTFESILVLTGVYQDHHRVTQTWHGRLDPCHQAHQNFPDLPNLCEPTFVARDVEEAIKYILNIEGSLVHKNDVNGDASAQVTRCCPYLDDVAQSP